MEQQMKKQVQRDVTVDVVRSIAIILMVSANMIIITSDTPPWIFRLTSSLAAPLFITLASMMVGLSYKKGSGFLLSLERFVFLFLIAGIFDISNQLVPFINVDVLYYIGISLPIMNLLGRLSNKILFVLGVAILAITPVLQSSLPYQQAMPAVTLPMESFQAYLNALIHDAPHRYFVDGWFPILPWLAISLFGLIVGKIRYMSSQGTVYFNRPIYIGASLTLLIVGGLIWWFFPGSQSIRYGYVELFYPPVPGFMMVAMGIGLTLLTVIDYCKKAAPVLTKIRPLGEASLFMYLFHIAVIDHVILPFGTISFGWRYFSYYLALIVTMFIIGVGLEKLRKFAFYKKMPHVVRWILG